jgi:hypothetical protein
LGNAMLVEDARSHVCPTQIDSDDRFHGAEFTGAGEILER